MQSGASPFYTLKGGRYETCGAALIRGRGSGHTPWGLGRAGARAREVVRRGAGRRAALGPPVPAAALGAHRGGAGGDAFGRDAVEGVGTGLFARAGGLRGHRGTPQPALRAGAPNPRHPRRRAPAREWRAGDALLPGQRDAWSVGELPRPSGGRHRARPLLRWADARGRGGARPALVLRHLPGGTRADAGERAVPGLRSLLPAGRARPPLDRPAALPAPGA